jgi:hypothetical protein
MSGVFTSRGIQVVIPSRGLTLAIDDHGKVTGNVTLHVRVDVCPTWVQLALRHLDDAKAKKASRVSAWAGTNESHKAVGLAV